jgi:predicted nucleic acid-binding protein
MLNSREVVGACAVTVAECFAGAHLAERPGWGEVFGRLEYWDITIEDAARSGVYRYDFARRGLALKLGDTLIAALAHRLGATVATANVRDFPMQDIVLVQVP